MTTEKLIKERKIKRLKLLFTPMNFEQLKTDILFQDNSRWEYEFDGMRLFVRLYDTPWSRSIIFSLDEIKVVWVARKIFAEDYNVLIEKLYCEFENKIVIDNTMQLSFL